MRLLQGDWPRCCKPGKPRVSHQSPPSTRFQPPRVKSDMAGAPVEPSTGLPMTRVTPELGPGCRPLYGTSTIPKKVRGNGAKETSEGRGREKERERRGENHLIPIRRGGAKIKPLSDLVPKVGITTHLSRYHSFPVGSCAQKSSSNLYTHDLPQLLFILNTLSLSPPLPLPLTRTLTRTSISHTRNWFTCSTSAELPTNYSSRSFTFALIDHLTFNLVH